MKKHREESEINKQFGYISGNRRLMEVAELLKSLFPNYRIYRYDEDEMLVLCINIKRQEMEQQVENLQKRLAGLGFGVAMGYSWSAHPHTMYCKQGLCTGNGFLFAGVVCVCRVSAWHRFPDMPCTAIRKRTKGQG